MATNLIGQSNDPNNAGVLGEGGTGVYGRDITHTGNGVIGYSDDGRGVWGHSKTGFGVLGQSVNGIGVSGESTSNEGVRGVSHNPHGGVVGINDSPDPGGNGGWFESTLGEGVRGVSHNPHGGVVGINDSPDPGGNGGWFESTLGEGVRGVSHNPHGSVVGINDSPDPGGNGGWFESTLGEGVRGTSNNANHGGVVGVNTGGGIAVYGTSDNGVGIHGKGGQLAGFFEGDVEITGHVRAPQSTITCFELSLSGSDCAENFEIGGATVIEPGSVMVIDNEGTLKPCEIAYDKKVGGVISGAGVFQPGITLGNVEPSRNRQPIALIGKVFCKADANYGAIEIGDLLTTSPTPGHAMKALDPYKAFGAVIGKALRPLQSGQELIPILIALQ